MSDGFGFGRKKLIMEIIKQTWGVTDPEKLKYSYNQLLYIVQEMMNQEGKSYFEKNTTNYGYNVFREFAKLLLYRNLANYDSMLLLTSDKGTGKSSAAIVLAREWCKLLGIKFDPKRHIAYNNNDVMKKIDILNKFEPIICFLKDTKIKTIDGKKNIQDINIGDYVLTHKNRFKKVLKIFKNTTTSYLKISTEKNILNVTDNHPILFDKDLNIFKKAVEFEIGEYFINFLYEKEKIISIEKIYKNVNVFNLEVDDDNTYVANNIIVHNCDESARFASSEDWAKRESKELKKKLGQVRTKHLLYIMCFPLKIYKIDKSYLQSYVNYWCIGSNNKISILDENGSYCNTPISDLTQKKNFKVLTYNIEKNIYEYKDCEKVIKTKKNIDLFEIELDNGLKVECTEDHPFLTQRGYVRLKDLKEEDKIETYLTKCIICDNYFLKKRRSICCSKICSKKRALNLYKEQKEEKIKYLKDYRLKNKEKLKEKRIKKINNNKEYYKQLKKNNNLKHREHILKKNKIYYMNNRISLLEKNKIWRNNNRDKINTYTRKYHKNRIQTDVNYRILKNLRRRTNLALKIKKAEKSNFTKKLLGCDLDFFKKYIESLFLPGMSWNNYGLKTWNIDHKIPCASFDLTNPEEQQKCFHYTNLQPLWAKDNLSKGAKLCWSKSNQ